MLAEKKQELPYQIYVVIAYKEKYFAKNTWGKVEESSNFTENYAIS